MACGPGPVGIAPGALHHTPDPIDQPLRADLSLASGLSTYRFDLVIWDDFLLRMTLKHVTEISSCKKNRFCPPPPSSEGAQAPRRPEGGKSTGRGRAAPILLGGSWGQGREQHTCGGHAIHNVPRKHLSKPQAMRK